MYRKKERDGREKKMDGNGGKATIYLKDKTSWKKFMGIAKREGRTASHILQKYIEEYNRIHEPGNPQSLMSSYSEDGAQTVATIEGRIRQLCIEQHHKAGSLEWGYIVSTVKDHGISDAKSRVAMSHRIRDWLRGRDIPVYS